MHKKDGYILFLLFSILSVCAILMSIYFSRTMIYRQLMQQLTQQQHAQLLNFSSMALAKTLILPEQKQDDAAQQTPKAKANPADNNNVKNFIKIFPYFNKEKKHELKQTPDNFTATLSLSIQSEQGKLNLNSLYDFKNKKFINEGKKASPGNQPNNGKLPDTGQQPDTKVFCVWLFNQIAAITGKPNLFQSFEQHLKTRVNDFNDVTELLIIPEFAEQFKDCLFFDPTDKNNKKIFLTDIFTVTTEQESLHPLLFTHSWCVLLGLQPKQNMSNDEIQKIILALQEQSSWETMWPKSLELFYQKGYKDLAQEIKWILTTRYEANIFSLLLKTKIGETKSAIFTIVKTNTKQHLIDFDVVKTYQI